MRRLLLLLIFVSPFNIVTSQQIKGIVTDANTNLPLIGSSIFNINNQTGTFSNELGEFSIQAAYGDMILVTYMGKENFTLYVTKEIENITIGLKTKVYKLKNIDIVLDKPKSILANPDYDKLINEKPHELPIKNVPKILKSCFQVTPMGITINPFTFLYYNSKKIKQKYSYMNSIQKRDNANLKYSYDFISLITKVEDEDELRRIKAHCYFSEDQILNSNYYQLGLMTKECYLEYLEKKQTKP